MWNQPFSQSFSQKFWEHKTKKNRKLCLNMMKVLINQNSNVNIGNKNFSLNVKNFQNFEIFPKIFFKNIVRKTCENTAGDDMLWALEFSFFLLPTLLPTQTALSSPQTASMIHFKWNYVYWSTDRSGPKTVHNSNNIVHVGLKTSLKTIETGLLWDHGLTTDFNEPLWFLVGLYTLMFYID